MPINYSNLGQEIKRFRLMNDIRQEDMAEKMGVSRATLINYEKGHTTINIDILNKLKNLYPEFNFDSSMTEKPKIIIDNKIDFKILTRVLISRKFYIISFTILSMALGLGSSFFFKKNYNAEISLYPAKKDMMQGISQFQNLAANFGMNTPKNDQDFNIPDVVLSRLIANKAIRQSWIANNEQKMSLIELWKLDSAPWYSFIFDFNIDSTIVNEKAIRKFKKHVQVSEDRLSGLINISTTFQDPYIAASVANFIGDQVEIYIQKENSAQSTKEKLFISERLSVVKSELQKAEINLKKFKETNRGYENSPELFMFYSQLFREVEAKKEVYLMLQQQLELARIEEVKQSPILHILDAAVPPINKSSPRRGLFLVMFFFLGFILSCARVIFRY